MPTSARTQDANGFLLIRQCPISSFGIFDYSAAQVGITDGDPNRIVKVFRPESAVSDPELLASLQVVPFINDHEMLSGFAGDDGATAPEDYGVDGVLFNVGYAKPWTQGDLKIFTRGMQSDLTAGKKDVSLGYTCDFLMQSGTFDGQDYEVVQTNMRGNHIALVDAGRVPGARVLDSRTGKRLCFDHLDLSSVQISVSQKGVPVMKRRTIDSNVVAQLQAQLKQLLPTFEAFLSQEAAEPEHQGAAGAGGAEGADPNAAAAAAPAANAAAAGNAGAMGAGGGEPGEAGAAEGEEDAGAMAGGAGGAGALEQCVSQLEALLAQLKQAMGGASAEPAGAAEGGGEANEGGESGDGNGEGGESGEGGEGGGESGEGAEDGVDPLEGTAQDPTGSNAPGADGEGEDGEGTEGRELGEGGQGRAPQGPAAGKHEGADAALRGFYGDLAVKNRLVDRLSKVVGTFDGAMDVARATARDVAVYGVKKLKLQNVKPGTEVHALDGYLSAFEAGARRSANLTTQKTADAAAAEAVPAIDAYFEKQEKK
jgi:uncharacterized protein